MMCTVHWVLGRNNFFIYLEIHSWGRKYSQKQNWNDSNHNRKVSRQCTDRYLQCKQDTVLNITGSYKYKQLIQQLVRSLVIRIKKHTNYKKQTENYEHTNL